MFDGAAEGAGLSVAATIAVIDDEQAAEREKAAELRLGARVECFDGSSTLRKEKG